MKDVEELYKDKDFALLDRKLWDAYLRNPNKTLMFIETIEIVQYEIGRNVNNEENDKIKHFVIEKDYNTKSRAWFEEFSYDIFQLIKQIKKE